MRTVNAATLSAVFALLLTARPTPAQPPPNDPPPKPPEDIRVMVRELEEAYKAPHEVDKDVLDELRKQYRNPTPEREVKLFRELRRLYATTPDQEQIILREVRRAYELQSPEQEERLFVEIRRNGKLPPGAIPAAAQADQSAKLFLKLDRDRDDALRPDEMPDALRGEWGRWDKNRDGAVDREEFAAYYQDQLGRVSAKVASGEITIKLPKGVTIPPPADRPAVGPALAARFGRQPPGLPAWFTDLDTDRDGQIGLYEWRRAGRPLADFAAMDLNGDGLLPADEYLRYVRMTRADEPPATAAGPAAKGEKPKKGP